jgi:hypothetical protein
VHTDFGQTRGRASNEGDREKRSFHVSFLAGPNSKGIGKLGWINKRGDDVRLGPLGRTAFQHIDQGIVF